MASSTKTLVKKRVKHNCIQKAELLRHTELLKRFNMILLGNGTPEDGLFFLFRKHIKDHDSILSDIKDIKDKLSTVTEINTEMEIQRRVKEEKEKLMKKMDDDNIAEVEKKKFSWTKFSIVVGALAFVVMAIFQVLNYSHNIEIKDAAIATESKVDELGSPVVVNPRGEFVPLPEGFTLKMWPKDFDGEVQDTVKQ